jgi:hypothetical protein
VHRECALALGRCPSPGCSGLRSRGTAPLVLCGLLGGALLVGLALAPSPVESASPAPPETISRDATVVACAPQLAARHANTPGCEVELMAPCGCLTVAREETAIETILLADDGGQLMACDSSRMYCGCCCTMATRHDDPAESQISSGPHRPSPPNDLQLSSCATVRRRRARRPASRARADDDEIAPVAVPRRQALRCPYCRDGVTRAGIVACAQPTCGTVYHRECWQELTVDHGACAILGCAGRGAWEVSPTGYLLRRI